MQETRLGVQVGVYFVIQESPERTRMYSGTGIRTKNIRGPYIPSKSFGRYLKISAVVKKNSQTNLITYEVDYKCKSPLTLQFVNDKLRNCL